MCACEVTPMLGFANCMMTVGNHDCQRAVCKSCVVAHDMRVVLLLLRRLNRLETWALHYQACQVDAEQVIGRVRLSMRRSAGMNATQPN